MAETILRTAQDGEGDPKVLERIALLETPDFAPPSIEVIRAMSVKNRIQRLARAAGKFDLCR